MNNSTDAISLLPGYRVLDLSSSMGSFCGKVLHDLGMEVIGNSPEEFAAVIKSEIPKWAKLLKDSGIKMD